MKGAGRRSATVRAGALVCTMLVPLTSACSVTRPLADGEPRPPAGADVQVRLTPAGSVRLAEEVGRTDRVLRGRLVDEPTDVVVLAVPSREQGRDLSTANLREVVLIPWGDVQALEVREFSRVRTAQFAAGAALAAYLVARFAFSAFGHRDTETEDPGEIPMRIPLFVFGR